MPALATAATPTRRQTPRIPCGFWFSEQAAEYLGFSLKYFRKLQASGQTPAIGAGRKGQRVRYTKEALDRWVLDRQRSARRRGRVA